MQDNQWDEQFRDHAWKEMRQLLDREMPVAPPRRRRWLAWIFLVVLLLGGGAYYVLWVGLRSGGELPATDVPAASSAPAAESSPPKNQLRSERSRELPVAGAEQPGAAAAPEATAGGETASPPQEVGVPHSFPDTRGERMEPPSAGEEEAAAPVAQAPPKAEAPSLSSAPEARNTLHPALPIEWLSPKPLLHEWEVSRMPAPIRRAGASSLLPRHWGIRTAALGGNGQAFNGAALGLIAEYGLGQSRWSLRTGLEYLYLHREMRRPQTSGTYDLAAEEDPTPANPGSEDAGMGGNYAVPLPSALRFRSHGLSLPLSLHRHLGKRFQLGVGTQLIYSFRNLRQAVDESLAPNSFGNLQDRNTRGLFFQNATAPLEREVFRRFDVALTGSLYYRPAARWQVELTYHYGLNDLAPSAYYEAYNRFGSLGVVYFLK